jgi:hypothetical protein
MNIFILSHNPIKAAEYHNNKHVVKMPTEYTQMLSWAYFNDKGEMIPHTYDLRNFPRAQGFYAFNKGHYNHPCTKWVRESLANWEYLLKLAYWTAKEYKHRYDKEHATYAIMLWMLHNPPLLPKRPLTEFPQAMPVGCQHDNVVIAYRTYYRLYKDHIAQWHSKNPNNTRKPPNWYY